MIPQADGIYPEWAHVDRNVEELAEETPDTKHWPARSAVRRRRRRGRGAAEAL
jgi:hypothetical protein